MANSFTRLQGWPGPYELRPCAVLLALAYGKISLMSAMIGYREDLTPKNPRKPIWIVQSVKRQWSG